MPNSAHISAMTKDAPKLGLDSDGSSKRRISSILKAPRASMKGFGVEQDEQEEIKPPEKRQNSRRVSFAATNNVRVFAKDIKPESPLLASVQNAAVGDDNKQNKRSPHFDGHEEQLMTGLHNMPLRFSHPKENFFPDPILPDRSVDRTVLLGDETGYMDMTRSHTICIENNDVFHPELNFDTSANVGTVPCKTSSNEEKDPLHLGFFQFLSSISKPAASSKAKPNPLKCNTNSSEAEMDKENIFPSRLTSPESQARQSRSSKAGFEQSMDMTRSHAVIDRKKLAQHNHTKMGSTSWCFGGDSDDMELTRSQTTSINFKAMDDVRSVDRCRSVSASDDTSGMVMTQILDSFEPNHLRLMSIPQPDNVQSSKQTRHDQFQRDGPFQTSNSDDMEITQSQTVLPETKFRGGLLPMSNSNDMEMTQSQTVILETRYGEEPFCKTSNSDDMDLTGCASVAIDPQRSFSVTEKKSKKRASFMPLSALSQTLTSDDMELTLSQTAVLETKYGGEPFRKTSNSNDLDITLSQSVREPFLMSNSDDMDLTGCANVAIDPQRGFSTTERSKKRASLMPLSALSQTLTGDDMEMTRSQTVVLETKYGGEPFRKMSNSNDLDITLSQTVREPFLMSNSDDMDLTGCANVAIDPQRSFSTTEKKSKKRASLMPLPALSQTSTGDDMEMTQSQTVVLENKYGGGLFPKSNSDDMDLTGCANVAVDSRRSFSMIERSKKPASLMPLSALSQTSTGDDMEMTQSQTVVLETKYGGGLFPTSNSDDMEMTGCANIAIDSRRNFSMIESSKKRASLMPLSALSQTSTGDDMEMTQSQTVVLENKYGGGLFPKSNSDDMDLTGCANIAIDSRRSFSMIERSKKPASFMPLSALLDTLSNKPLPMSNGDDMEITRSQTVVLETKYSGGIFPTSNSDKEMTRSQTIREPFLMSNSDDMDLTGCANVAIDPQRSFSMTKSKKRASFMPLPALSQTLSGGDMEITLSQTAVLETKYVGEPFCKTSNSDDMEKTRLQTVREPFPMSNSNDMEMTRSQTVVLQTKLREDPFREKNSGPGLAPRPPTSDSAVKLAITQKPAGNGPLPVQSEFMELTCQTLVLPHTADDMHSTGCANVTADCGKIFSKTERPKKLASFMPPSTLLQAPSGDDMEMTRCQTVALDAEPHVEYFGDAASASFRSDDKGASHEVTIATKRKKTTDSRDYGKLDRDMFTTRTDMELAGCGAIAVKAEDLPETAAVTVGENSSSDLTDMELTKGQTIVIEPLNSETSTLKDRPDECNMEITTDPFNDRTMGGDPNKETAKHSRRGSLASLQMRLQSITHSIGEPGSVTAPVLSLNCASPPQPLEETQKEPIVPFSLKNSLMARLSLGGAAVPRLPQAKSPSPKLQEDGGRTLLQLERHLGHCYEVDRLDNEVIADQDLSSTALNATEPLMTSSQRDTGHPTLTETSENSETPGPVTRVVYDTSSSSSSASMKCEGISESTLNSQFDSQFEVNSDHEFDFYKKLEDGSLTVSEFLKYYGAEFVIHKSRPSALPDNFRPAQTRSTKDTLEDKHIYRPKQRVYEAHCQQLTEMTDGLKTQMAELEKPLRSINGALLQDMGSFSKVQLQKFGSRLKEQRLYYRKRSKAHSHEMKKALYSELLKTTQDAKQSLTCRIEETNDILKDLDRCMNELQSELEGMNGVVMGDEQFLIKTTPVLKAKQDELETLKSDLDEKEKEMCKLDLQVRTSEETQGKLQTECTGLERRMVTMTRLNEWRFKGREKNRAVFTFLHDTVHLEVKPRNVTESECMQVDLVQDMEVSCNFRMNGELSQCHALMVHKLLAEYMQSQNNWTIKYPTTRHLPLLLHDVGLVVSRLRLLGEEIHQLKYWGGQSFGVLHVACVDTLVDITFSSLKAFVKFHLHLALTPDYPLGPLRVHKFQNCIGDTRMDQIEEILSTVAPAKNYLTRVVKRIHSDLLG